MLRLLLLFIKNCYLYKPRMTESEVYQYFLKDCKSKSPHKITQEFCKDLKGIEHDIVDLDSRNYYIKGNNNLVRLLIKHEYETESSLKTIKRKLRNNLYLLYVSTFGL